MAEIDRARLRKRERTFWDDEADAKSGRDMPEDDSREKIRMMLGCYSRDDDAIGCFEEKRRMILG